ncbi:MAG: type II toxin-antitoxin system RelE/ParE family toxin [Pirellulales bacterium]
MEESAEWWAHERSPEQAERWYAGIRQAVAGLAEHPEQWPQAAESSEFAYVLREILYGLGPRPTHRAVFTIVKQTVVVLSVRHAAQDQLKPDDLRR